MPSDRAPRPARPAAPPPADTGLLAPVRAGTAVEAVTGDEAVLRALLEAEAALARAQGRLGIVPPEAVRDVVRLCAEIEIDPVTAARRARGAGNPVVPLVESLRAAAPARLHRFIHHGATSQDIMDTGLMLVARRAQQVILADLDRALAALAALAEAHRDTVMAGRTLGRHAVPITFGLKAASWLLGVAEARAALAAIRPAAQLGGAAGTLGPPELAGLFAEELGLAAPELPWHARRTRIAAFGAALAAVAGALGKIATDVVLLAQDEVAEVAEPAAPGRGGSSTMAHKRNPVLSIMIRSAALQVPALAQILHGSLLAEHERAAGAWHAEWLPLRECLRLTGGAAETAAELLAGLEVHPDRMAAGREVSGHLSGGTGAAAALIDRALAAYRRATS